MALHGTRVVQQLPSTAARAMAQSRPSTIGLITLGTKETGKPSARNSHAGFDAAGTGNRLTDRLVRHSQRKRGATDRSVLRGTAPVLDPTERRTEASIRVVRCASSDPTQGEWPVGLSVS